MIPKIIHYCWLSGDPIPSSMQQYMHTWKEKLVGYEFVLWDKSRFDIHSVKWVEQAYEERKYAFAADYIRLYALYTMGGIYMDMDVEVVKSFDGLLNYPYLLGAETTTGIEGGIIGAEKGSPVIKQCLDFYDGRCFRNDDGTINIAGLPKVMYKQITQKCEIEITNKPNFTSEKIQVFPFDFFTAKSADTGKVKKTRNTYTVHHFAGSWLHPTFSQQIKRRIKVLSVKLFGESIVREISDLVNHRKRES